MTLMRVPPQISSLIDRQERMIASSSTARTDSGRKRRRLSMISMTFSPTSFQLIFMLREDQRGRLQCAAGKQRWVEGWPQEFSASIDGSCFPRVSLSVVVGHKLQHGKAKQRT